MGPPDPTPVDPSPSLPGEISANLAIVDPSIPPAKKLEDESWYLPPDSKVRLKALHIVSLRIAGMDDADIAKELGISPKSIAPYVYRAGKNKWIANWDNPKNEIQNALLPKAIKNLNEMLDDPTLVTEKTIRHETSMKLFEMTAAKEFGEQGQAQAPQTMVAIRIEMPAGPVQQMRDDTTGGVPAYATVIDGETK